MLISILLFLAVAVSPNSAAVETSGSNGVSAAPAASQQDAAPKPKKICKSTSTTASRIGKKRVCKTMEQWGEDARQGDSGSKSGRSF